LQPIYACLFITSPLAGEVARSAGEGETTFTITAL